MCAIWRDQREGKEGGVKGGGGEREKKEKINGVHVQLFGGEGVEEREGRENIN